MATPNRNAPPPDPPSSTPLRLPNSDEIHVPTRKEITPGRRMTREEKRLVRKRGDPKAVNTFKPNITAKLTFGQHIARVPSDLSQPGPSGLKPTSKDSRRDQEAGDEDDEEDGSEGEDEMALEPSPRAKSKSAPGSQRASAGSGRRSGLGNGETPTGSRTNTKNPSFPTSTSLLKSVLKPPSNAQSTSASNGIAVNLDTPQEEEDVDFETPVAVRRRKSVSFEPDSVTPQAGRRSMRRRSDGNASPYWKVPERADVNGNDAGGEVDGGEVDEEDVVVVADVDNEGNADDQEEEERARLGRKRKGKERMDRVVEREEEEARTGRSDRHDKDAEGKRDAVVRSGSRQQRGQKLPAKSAPSRPAKATQTKATDPKKRIAPTTRRKDREEDFTEGQDVTSRKDVDAGEEVEEEDQEVDPSVNQRHTNPKSRTQVNGAARPDTAAQPITKGKNKRKAPEDAEEEAGSGREDPDEGNRAKVRRRSSPHRPRRNEPHQDEVDGDERDEDREPPAKKRKTSRKTLNAIDVVWEAVVDSLAHVGKGVSKDKVAMTSLGLFADLASSRLANSSSSIDKLSELTTQIRQARSRSKELRQELLSVQKERNETKRKMRRAEEMWRQGRDRVETIRDMHEFVTDITALSKSWSGPAHPVPEPPSKDPISLHGLLHLASARASSTRLKSANDLLERQMKALGD